MMKKILAIMLSMGLALSMAACGTKSKPDDVESETTTEVATTTTEVETKEESAEKEVVEEESTYIPHPNADGTSFQLEGYWYYEANSSEDGDKKWYIYDLTAGEVIGESTMNLIDYDASGPAYRGICGTVSYEWGKKELIDVTTGQVVVQLNENQDFICGWNDGMLLVAETQATLEQTTVALGLLNNKGEWIRPLTTVEGEYGAALYNACDGRDVSYIGEGKYLCENATYDDMGGAAVYDAMSGKVAFISNVIYAEGLGTDGNKVFIRNGINHCLSVDMETGEVSNFLESDLYKIDSRTDLFYRQDDFVISIVDTSGTVTTYDLSKYTSVDFPRDATTSRMVALIWNEQSSQFLCLINADGSMEFEPIETSTLPAGMDTTIDDTIIMTEEKLVGWDDDDGKQVFIYNTTTKETINTEVPYEVLVYYPSYDLFVVNGEHPEYGEGRYLVDGDDLETLINPFEK